MPASSTPGCANSCRRPLGTRGRRDSGDEQSGHSGGPATRQTGISKPDPAALSPPAAAIDAEDLDRWADEVPAGANGLVFLPYLAGERSPNWDANARGVLVGLSLAHDYRHLARATLEGVGYRMRSIFDPVEEVAGRATEVRAAGGFTRSPLWVRIVADMLGRPLVLSESHEASALGAAQLAMLGAGIVNRFEDLAPLARTGATVPPDAECHALYTRLYALYQRLYAALRPHFASVAQLQAELAAQAQQRT
jgi:gluconokinase